MRRKDREVLGDENIAKIIEQCTTCHIAMTDDAEASMPYVIPLSFGYSLNSGVLELYFHCAHVGKNLTASAKIRMSRSACALKTASKFTKTPIAKAGAFTQALSGKAKPKSSKTSLKNAEDSRS